MTSAIRKEYFESNLNDLKQFYDLNGDYYTRSVNEENLTLRFAAEDDCESCFFFGFN